MTRDALVDVLHARSPLFISRETFVKLMDGWELQGVEVGGKLAFITAQRGAEFHFADLGTGQAISRRMIREFLKPIIAAHGFALTRTPKTDARQDRFNRKIGFTAIAENETDRIYRIERIPWMK